MGYRLSKIYTKTGDDGTTALGDGQRVDKDNLRVEVYGEVDELNSTVGLLLAQENLPVPIRDCLTTIQHDLFNVGGELCLPGQVLFNHESSKHLELALDKLNEALPPLKNFILPGGGQAASVAHLARTVCRRVERRLVSLHKIEQVNVAVMIFINRLSDYLFVVARTLARQDNGSEVLWQQPQS